MKKHFFTFFALFLVFIALDTKAQSIKLGLAATPGISWMRYNDGQGNTDGYNKLGINYGLIVDLGFADRYALSTGVFAEHGGAKVETVLGDVNTKLTYVNIPVLLKMKTNQFGKFTPFGQVGVTPGVAVSRKVDDIDAKDGFGLFNVSLTAGAGTEYELGGGTSAFAAFHIDNGLVNVGKDTGDGKITKSFAGLRLGIFF
ncbi:MAG TPA: outer membrane beta-barrel protein [Chitinophagales bacterium]|nr:outer membrane beta-barrel protein [Chitinophagales bacterium]HRK26369.1 outer membrane beta-barrel protein [Chitinophagales bacterium]